jgi:molybdate-binding protein
VALGAAAGVTTEPAALAFRLDFFETEEHAVELWIKRELLGIPEVSALLDLLSSGVFLRRLGAVPGYDLVGCGSRVA